MDEIEADRAATIWRGGKLGLLYLPLVLLLAVPFLVGEEFPFSPFPMYDQWQDETYLIYFQDRYGEPLPIQVITTYKAGRYRKMFDSRLRVAKTKLQDEGISKNLSDFGPDEWGPAGVWLLEWIDRNCEPGRVELLDKSRPVRVVRRGLRLVGGEIAAEDVVVASDEDRPGWAEGGLQ